MAFDARWPAVLDALLADAARAQSRAVEELGALYVPPTDLGPLPVSLRARAVDVLASLEVGTASLQTQIDAVRLEITRLARSERVGVTVPERRGAFEVRA